jgi:hypothetical protein
MIAPRDERALRQLDALLPTSVCEYVAILFDWESWWALELDTTPSCDIRLVGLWPTICPETAYTPKRGETVCSGNTAPGGSCFS